MEVSDAVTVSFANTPVPYDCPLEKDLFLPLPEVTEVDGVYYEIVIVEKPEWLDFSEN